MGFRDRINAARVVRETRAALADHTDDPADTGTRGRADTHRLHQNAMRQAERD